MVTLSKYDGGFYVLEVNMHGVRVRFAFVLAEMRVSDVMQRQMQEVILEIHMDN